MNNIKIELTMEQFLSLKTVLLYVMDNEQDHYEDCLDEDYDVFVDAHVYAHAKKVAEALS